MSSPERSKVCCKRKLGEDETDDTIVKGESKVVESQSEPQVKMEEDLGIIVPLNIDPVKVEEDAQPKVVQDPLARSPKRKRRRVRFSSVVSYHGQVGRRAPAQRVERRTAQLATGKKSRRQVDTAGVGRHPRPTKQLEPAQGLSTRRKTKKGNQQPETRTLESRLETAVANGDRISNILAQLLVNAELIAQEIKLIRAGMDNLQKA